MIGSLVSKLNPSSASSPPQKQVSLGPQYQSLLDANPYRNQEYQKSGWQNFLSMLGFRTQADAWKENMSVQAAEYDAAIAQKAYDERYDSAAAQAARMREAGINPDISGGENITAGESAALPQDPSTPMQSTGDEEELQRVVTMGAEIASGCMNAFTTALGIVSSIQGIHRNRLDNTMQAIQNEGALQGLADQVLPYLIPPTPEKDEEGNPWMDNSLALAEMFVGQMPKKVQGKFRTSILNRLNSAPTQRKAWEEWRGRVTARKGYFMESNEFYDESDTVLNIISSGLAKMNEDIYKAYQESSKAGYEAETAAAGYEKEYNEAMSADEGAKTMAGAEKSTAALTSTNNSMVQAMRSNLKEIVDKLDAASKEKGIKGGLASVAMSLISILQLYISSQGMPSISRSQSSGYRVGPRSEASNQFSSFSIGF